MKTIHILILAVLLVDVFCLLRKTQSTTEKKKVNLKTSQFSEYAQQILASINEYRTQNSYPPMIEYSTELEATAAQEANNIISYQNFGTHENFGTLKNQISNEFLTEIILRITYSDQLPPSTTFCQHVVEAIAQNQNKYLTYEYTKGGVALQQDTTTGQYVIVIHLAKSLIQPDTPVDQIPIYESCLMAKQQGYTGNQINVHTPSGEIKTIICDQVTQDGGWSMILDIQSDLERDNIIPIDDLGLTYNEILFRTKEGYEFNSRTASDNQYKFDGYLFQSNAFKFGNLWYISQEYDDNFYYDRDSVSQKEFYQASTAIQVLVPSQICYFEEENIPSFCAKEFIYKSPLPGRLTAISDCESIGQYAFENNRWKAYFQIYVR